MTQRPTALVTGGAKRIGAAVVRDLAAHGWSVAIHCNRSVAEANAPTDEQVAGTPLWRPVDPADFGRAIRFIVDTPSMTGQLLLLDSSQHISWKTRNVVE